MRRLLALASAAALAISSPAIGQVPNFTGNMVPNQPPLVIQGPITPGDCVQWVNAYTIGDSGAPCGGGTPPATCSGTGWDFTQACNSQYVVVY